MFSLVFFVFCTSFASSLLQCSDACEVDTSVFCFKEAQRQWHETHPYVCLPCSLKGRYTSWPTVKRLEEHRKTIGHQRMMEELWQSKELQDLYRKLSGHAEQKLPSFKF